MTSPLVAVLIDTLRLGPGADSALTARWKAADLTGLAELVEYEGAAIWLFRRLRSLGILASLPPDVTEKMRTLAFEATAIRMQVEAEGVTAIGVLADAGVPVIAIKGIARCILAPRYRYLDARITSDVDLLVPQARLDDAERCLRAVGYAEAAVRWKPVDRHHHRPPLTRGTVTVELHDSTSVHLLAGVAWSRANDRSESVEWGGGGRMVRVPHPTELVWSAIAHGIEDDTFGFRLKRFLEVAALAGENAPVDWTVIEHRLADSREHDPSIPDVERRNHLRAWLDAAMWFVAPERRPPRFAEPGFDIPALLQWRHRLLIPRRWLGGRLRAHLLEEGARVLIGMDLQPSPPTASPAARMRRAAGNEASRAMFQVWRLVAGG
ncbi:MAG: nucleotidyltransferase family protein [Gemmatimonadales bacterium]